MNDTETPAERRLREMVDMRWIVEASLNDADRLEQQWQDRLANTAAIDMGREALATGREIVEAYDGYRGRGVKPAQDEYWRLVQAIETLRALLARAGEE